MVSYFQWSVIMVICLAVMALSLFTGMRFGRIYFIIFPIAFIVFGTSLVMMWDTRNRNRRRMNWERP